MANTKKESNILVNILLFCMAISIMYLAIEVGLAKQNTNHIIHIIDIQEAAIKNILQTVIESESFVERDCIVTAYCKCSKCCGKNADGITASGHKIKQGDKFVASSTGYPFNTKVYIEGYSELPVRILDRGKDFADNHFDVYFDDHEKAIAWGKRVVRVKIFKGE